MPFDPNADFELENSSQPRDPPGQAEKIAALRKKITETQSGNQKIELPGWMAAPVGAVSSALPGIPGVAGGVGAMAAGHPFSEGYRMGTQGQNDLLAKHPVAGTIGAIGGSVLSPVSKAVGALSFPARAVAGGVMGAAQGAGMATNTDELKRNSLLGGAFGIGGTVASEGVTKGLGYIGNKLGESKNRLIDYFAKRGTDKIAQNQELSVLQSSQANAIGAPGPKSVPNLETSDFLRTPEEKALAGTASRALPIVSRSRPEAAIVQTMGPEYVNDVIGNKVTNYKAGIPLYKALNQIGRLGGADIHGSQLQSNIEKNMAAKQLGPQSPLSSLFESATGQDLGESAKRVANTADENLFHNPNAIDPGAKSMQSGANDYLSRMNNNLANRHGGGYVPKTKFDFSAEAATANANPNVTMPVDMGKPISSVSATEPHSSFLGAGQPSSQVKYSQYSPSEAADIGGSAERINSINLGRQGSNRLSDMLKNFGSGPITGNIPGVGAAARIGAKAFRPETLEVGAGLASKAGKGIEHTGEFLGKYITPERTTSAFLTAAVPKSPDDQDEELSSQ